MGNLRSVAKALEKVGGKVTVSDKPKMVLRADKLVLPGVGAFKDAMRQLRSRGLIEPIKKSVKEGKPFLGLCLGLQLIFSESQEDGLSRGLDFIEGRVVKFKSKRLKIPHMGWNTVIVNRSPLNANRICPLLRGIPEGAYMYFVHSYYARPRKENCVAAWTNYGIKFPSVIWKDNIYATQFHPEKSQELGLKILRNFSGL